jgi:hypothetical protein
MPDIGFSGPKYPGIAFTKLHSIFSRLSFDHPDVVETRIKTVVTLKRVGPLTDPHILLEHARLWVFEEL